jgi:hypothetical protein
MPGERTKSLHALPLRQAQGHRTPDRAERCRRIDDLEASAAILDENPDRWNLAAELRQQADALRRLG